MIEEFYRKQWDLRFTSQELNLERVLNPVAIAELEKIYNDYPTQKHKIITIIGNIVVGNLIFNEIIESLLSENRIKNRCLRLSIFNPEIRKYKFSSGTENDIVMFDNLEFNLLYNEQKIFLLENIDLYLEKSNLLILNVSSLQSVSEAPDIIQNLMEYSLNIGIKKI